MLGIDDPLHCPDMSKALTPSAQQMIQRAADELAEVMTTPLTKSRERYLRELTAVSRAAAIGGEYAAAFKGYELLGKALGHVTAETNAVHLHTHRHAHLTQASDAELADMLAEASARAAKPAEVVPADADLAAICA